MNALPEVRLAVDTDVMAMNAIYNHYVAHSTCTYQEEAETLDNRLMRLKHHGHEHPLIVAIIDSHVVGWGSLFPYHPRSAYRFSVENAVYVDHQHQRQGIGSLLLRELIKRARDARHRVIIARIDSAQPGSIALHAKFGFEKAGHLKNVGFKFGRWLDVIYMQLSLDDVRPD